ncbi:NADH-quinone oxidoreductase subunit M [Buchnera aphidicola (Mindarus keteleerifoliae)]|uniref:complex I subunit 4 family protein n=1 Tax=Buchnera aphidicola TaxID=9 RepID=UPI0031B720DD
MLLLLLIIIPFLGGFISWKSEQYNIKYPRWIALITMSIVFSLLMYFYFYKFINFVHRTSDHRWIIEFSYPWIPKFGISFHLAMDGLSLLMIFLSSILGIISVLCSWNFYQHYKGLFYLSLLHIFSATMGIFLSVDLFLFFCFWEIILIPIYLLIIFPSVKNNAKRRRISSANSFFMYSQFSSFIMLVVIINLSTLYYIKYNFWTFDYELLINLFNENKNFSILEHVLMIGMLIGFAVKIPIVPFHGWFPNVHRYLPVVGSIDIIGFLSKTGIYGILKFVIPLFPNSSHNLANFFVFLGLLNIFYGALLAFSQSDLKKVIAYGSISHTGLIFSSIYAYNQISYEGAIIYLVSCSFSTSALFIITSLLKKYFHTKNIYKISGLLENFSWLPGFFLFFCFSSIGLPGTGSFIGELMILMGIFEKNPTLSGIFFLGLMCSVVYTLRFMQNICYGNYKNVSECTTISSIDILTLFIISFFLFFIGLNSKFIINILCLTKPII